MSKCISDSISYSMLLNLALFHFLSYLLLCYGQFFQFCPIISLTYIWMTAKHIEFYPVSLNLLPFFVMNSFLLIYFWFCLKLWPILNMQCKQLLLELEIVLPILSFPLALLSIKVKLHSTVGHIMRCTI